MGTFLKKNIGARKTLQLVFPYFHLLPKSSRPSEFFERDNLYITGVLMEKCMNERKLSLPENWNKMSFGEQWIWILDKQRELEENLGVH